MGFHYRRNAKAADRDVYQEVTDKVIAAIEAGADPKAYRLPWHKVSELDICGALPVNQDGRPYSGINVPLLWVTAIEKGYTSNVWGTYKAWQAKGAQVRKGEKASFVIVSKRFLPKPKPGQKPEDVKPIPFVKGYPVWNAAQVDGYKAPTATVELPPVGPARDAFAERFFDAVGITTHHVGNIAAYYPALDVIKLPALAQFHNTARYYAVRGHENVHATGHESRLGRDLTGRFKTQAYAAEELVAELGAAFLCAILGIDNEPREDHAQYCAGYLEVLKSDKRAIFTAASAAQKAVNWLVETAAANGCAIGDATAEGAVDDGDGDDATDDAAPEFAMAA